MSEKSPGSLVEMIEAIRLGNYIGIGSGRCRKSTLWAADIVTLIPKIPAIEGIYNLTDSYHPSYKELEVMITKLLGKKSPVRMPYLVAKLIAWLGDIFGNIIPLNSKKLNTINSTLTFDDQKARKTFDWKPSNAIERWTESMIETKTYKS
jgi:NAD dependent epimerase/dehydratase family enzyme